MRGRKPKPTNSKLLAGNPGKRKVNAQEPRPPGLIPPCPRHLSAEARREWKRISVGLRRVGLLSQIDRAALAAYCQWWARWVKAEQKLAKQGEVVKASNPHAGRKAMVRNPWFLVAIQAWDHVRKLLVEFGMTPSSRSRLPIRFPACPEEDERARKMRELLSFPRSTKPPV